MKYFIYREDNLGDPNYRILVQPYQESTGLIRIATVVKEQGAFYLAEELVKDANRGAEMPTAESPESAEEAEE